MDYVGKVIGLITRSTSQTQPSYKDHITSIAMQNAYWHPHAWDITIHVDTGL